MILKDGWRILSIYYFYNNEIMVVHLLFLPLRKSLLPAYFVDDN